MTGFAFSRTGPQPYLIACLRGLDIPGVVLVSSSTEDGGTSVQLPKGVASQVAMVVFVVIAVGLGALRFLLIAAELPGVGVVTVTVLASLSPLLAAITVATWTGGRDGRRDLWRRATHWRVRPGWFALGLLLPAVLYGTVLGAYVALGGVAPVIDLDVLPLVMLEILVVGPLFLFVEEIGWRGWLQRALQSRASGLVAAVSVGVVWFGWHLPLLYLPGSPQSRIAPAAFAALLIAAGIVFAGIFNATEGSVPAVVAAHLGFNLALGTTILALPEGATAYVALCAIATALLAVPVVRSPQAALRGTTQR